MANATFRVGASKIQENSVWQPANPTIYNRLGAENAGRMGQSIQLQGELDMNPDAARQMTHYRWGFIGVVFGSTGWLVSLLFAVRHLPIADQVTNWVMGATTLVWGIDAWIWSSLARKGEMTKWTFFAAVAGALLAASVAAVVLEFVCRPALIRGGLPLTSFLWIPVVAGVAVLYIAIQFRLQDRKRTR